MSFESPPQSPAFQESDKALVLIHDHAKQLLMSSLSTRSRSAFNAIFDYVLSESTRNPVIEKEQKAAIEDGVAFYKKRYAGAHIGIVEHAEVADWLDRFPPKRY